MNPQRSLFDPDVSRGRKNKQSKASHERLKPYKTSLRFDCHIWIEMAKQEGRTLKELCFVLDKYPHQLSGRLTELRNAGAIYDSGETRDGCTVWRAK
jgi:hypothetical protein